MMVVKEVIHQDYWGNVTAIYKCKECGFEKISDERIACEKCQKEAKQ